MSFSYYLSNPKQGDIHVWTDAATTEGTGIGGYTSTGFYFQVKWNDILPMVEIHGQLKAVLVQNY